MQQLRPYEHYRRRPDVFELRRSWRLTAVWTLVALAGIAVVIAVVRDYPAVVAELDSVRGGRRLPGVVAAPLFIAIGAGAAAFATRMALRRSRFVVHRSTGARAVIARRAVVGSRPESADELHRRFSTGDPRVYLPLPAPAPGASVSLEIRRLRGGRLAWVAITAMHDQFGRRGVPLPLIELTGRAADALAEVRGRDFARPARPAAIEAFTREEPDAARVRGVRSRRTRRTRRGDTPA